jgi:hypothetical protein
VVQGAAARRRALFFTITRESYCDRPTWSPALYNEIAYAELALTRILLGVHGCRSPTSRRCLGRVLTIRRFRRFPPIFGSMRFEADGTAVCPHGRQHRHARTQDDDEAVLVRGGAADRGSRQSAAVEAHRTRPCGPSLCSGACGALPWPRSRRIEDRLKPARAEDDTIEVNLRLDCARIGVNLRTGCGRESA